MQAVGKVQSFLPSKSEIEANSTVAAEVAKKTKEGLANMVETSTTSVFSNVFGNLFPLDPTSIQDAVNNIQTDDNARRTTEGFVFEGLINAMTGAKPGGGMSNFDFPSSSITGKKDALTKFFGGGDELNRLIKADAKRKLDNKNLNSIAGKVANDFSKGLTEGITSATLLTDLEGQKAGTVIPFAKGGSVSDTVPAMLTPGEYVINKRSAQQIGYGALGKMNKHGAQGFAKGGAVGGVQYFENGDEVKPLAPGGNLPGPKLDKLNAEFAALALEVAELEAELSSVNTMLDESEVALDAHTKQILESKKAELESVTESKKGSLAAKGESVEIESRRVAAGSSGIKPPPKEPPAPVVKADTVIAAPTPTSSVPQDMFAPIVAGSDPMVGAGSLVPGGTPSPALSGDALGSSTQEVSTKINGLGQVIEQLIGNVNQFDTGISAATAEVTTSFAQVGTSQQGLVNINQQVVNSGGQLDTLNEQVVQGLQEQSQALDRSTQELTEQIAASDNAAAADRKKAEKTAGATKSSIGLTAAFFALQSVLAMLPTEIEETDGVFKRMAKTGVKTALSLFTLAFIVKQVAGEQTLASIATKLKTAADLKAAGTTSAASLAAAGGLYKLSAAANFASASLKNLGVGAGVGFALVAAASYLFFASMQSLADEAKQAAIESGNIDTAGTEALNASAYGVAAVLSVVAIAALAAAVAVGAVTLPFAAVAVAIGVVVAAGLAFAGQFEGVMNLIRDGLSALTFGLIASTTVIRTRAEADAAATNAAERLKEATEAVSEAFKAVTDGSKTAVQALLENSDAQRAFNSAGDATRRELLANAEEEGTGSDARGLRNRRKVIGQFITQKGTEDGVSDDTKAQMEALGIDDAEVKAFKESTDKIFDLIKEEADIRARAAKEMIISGRGMVGDEAISQAEFVAEQIARIGPAFEQLTPDQQADIMEDLNKEYENQLKAVIDNIKTLNLFNFGLTETNGAIAMASAKIDNLNMAFDSGASRIRSSINKLSTIIEDGATMDPAELQQNLTAINKELSNFGVDPRSVDNITKQFGALNTVQSSFRIETEKLVAEMQTSGGGFGSPEAFTEKLQERLSQVAIAGGADETAVNKLMTSLPDLSSDDVTALMAGDTSVLADGFSEVNDKLKATLETMAKIASLTEEVAKLNADRLDAETALFAAQKTAIDLQVEGAQIQAKFGGKVVSSAVLRQSAISKANVGTSRSGLSDLQSGSVGEIRRRNEQIRAGVFSIQSGGRANVAGGGGFFGAGPQVTGAGFSSQGQTTEAREKALRQAQQEQISTIKALIAAEEAHLKTIQEKNRLEKESLQSLVDGDVEEFLKKQAAVGATAAIATGDTRLQGIFGAEALGGAFKNLETQQAAGVTDLFGQQIGGAGGLLEQASGAALSARGVTDPRMAALMAGTTGAEEASKTNIRDLAGELGATGDVGVGIAEMDLETAEFKVAQATIVVQKAMQETQTKSREAANIREDAQKRSNDILKRSEEELKKIEANTAPLNERGSAYTHDIHSEKLNREANKIKEKILKGTLVGNKEADLRETQLQSGKFTGGTRKALVTGGSLASINQAIQKGAFRSAASKPGALGQFARGSVRASNVATRFGGALGRGGTGFAKTLQHGGGFKDAFKAAFRGFGRESGLTKKMAELAKAFKAGGPGSMAGRLKDFIQPFKDGAARGSRIRALRTGIKGKGFESTFKALMPKGFKGNVGNFLGSLKELAVGTKNLTKDLGGLAGKFGKSASEMTGRFGFDKFVKKPAQFLGKQGSRLAGATLGRGVNAIAGTQVGQAFRAGRAGQMLTSRGGAFQQLGGPLAGRGGLAGGTIKNTAGTRVANILGKSTKTIGQFSKNLSQQGGKKLLGKGLEGAGKLGGKAFAGMGRGIPLIGAAISAGFGAYEAKQAGESTSGILGGAVLGGLTGSAYAGDSIFTSLANMAGADIERGGAVDKGLGVLGAGLHGATIGAGVGTAVGGPVGTLVGAGVGAALGVGAELLKIANSVERVADAREVEQELVLKTGTTTETLGLKLAADGSALSSSRETGISGFEEAARQRDALLASTQQGASPILAPTSVQAAGGPAVVGGGPLPEVITGGGAAVGGVSGGFDQAGLMQVMNAFSQNIGSFGVEMKRFNDGLAQNINELKNLKFKIKLDGPTNVNVNFKNTGFLSQLTEGLKEELLRIVAEEMVPRIDHNTGGDHIMRNGV